VDLGTVLRHELGHILGYGDLDPAAAGDDIMSGTILPGERRGVAEPASILRDIPVGSNPHSAVSDDLEHSDIVPGSSTNICPPARRRLDHSIPAKTTSVQGLPAGRSKQPKMDLILPEPKVQTEDLLLLDNLFTDPLGVFED
jgi:hypothetical protein